MPQMTGTVVIVQEGRLHLIDAQGAGHLFILGHGCAAETAQLRPLQTRQAQLRVTYSDSANVIGRIAERIEVLDTDLEAQEAGG